MNVTVCVMHEVNRHFPAGSTCSCRMAVRPAVLHGLKMVLLMNSKEVELVEAEEKMLKLRSGMMDSRWGHSRTRVREAGLSWSGHVQRRDTGYTGRRISWMVLPSSN